MSGPSLAEAHTEPNAADQRDFGTGGSFGHMGFDALLASGTADQRRFAVYLLIRSLMGEPVEREAGVYDAEGFLYAYVMPPSQRERLRILEDPHRWHRLLEAVNETNTVPMQAVLDELQHLDQSHGDR